MSYFDNASTSYPKFLLFYEETMKIYQEIGVNFSRNNSLKSKQAENIKEALIKNLKTLSSSKDHEVIINSSATFSFNEILMGLDYSTIKTVYITPFEHNSAYRVLKKIERENKIEIEYLKFDKFDLDIEDMNLRFMSKKPDLIICNSASNVFGNILPASIIFQEAKKYRAITILDCAQTLGVLNFSDVILLTDFLIFAGHKNLYGPSGIGGYLYNSKILLKPLLYGGTGIKSEEQEMPSEIPERFEAGSPNTLGIIGLKLSTDEILRVGIENIYMKKKENLTRLMSILKHYKGDIKIYSVEEKNIGIISILPTEYTAQELEKILNEYGIIVRVGMHCTPLAHKQIGTTINGTVRFSVGYFNTENDFEILEGALNEIF